MASKTRPLHHGHALATYLGVDTVEDNNKCGICDNPAYTRCLLPCGHNDVCYVCMARMSMLMDTKACPYCKDPIDKVFLTRRAIVHDDAVKKTDPSKLKSFKIKSGIEFLTPEQSMPIENLGNLTEPLCWYPECRKQQLVFPNLAALNAHHKDKHSRMHCSVCLDGRSKQCFLAEQLLFVPSDLQRHIREGERTADSCLQPHQQCRFCKEVCFGEDELKQHHKKEHFPCAHCSEVFGTYEKFFDHSTREHYPCREPQCLDLKFIVFKNKTLLLAHMEREHGHTLDFSSLADDRPKPRHAHKHDSKKNTSSDDNQDAPTIKGSIDVGLAFAAAEGSRDEETHLKWQIATARAVTDKIFQLEQLGAAAAQQANKQFNQTCRRFLDDDHFRDLSSWAKALFQRNATVTPEFFAHGVLTMFWETSCQRADAARARQHGGKAAPAKTANGQRSQKDDDSLLDMELQEASELISILVATLPDRLIKLSIEAAVKSAVEKAQQSAAKAAASGGALVTGAQMLVSTSDVFPDALRTVMRTALARVPEKQRPAITAAQQKAIENFVRTLSATEAQGGVKLDDFLRDKCDVSGTHAEALESLRPAWARLGKDVGSLQEWVRQAIEVVARVPPHVINLANEYLIGCSLRISEAIKDVHYPTLGELFGAEQAPAAQPSFVSMASMAQAKAKTNALLEDAKVVVKKKGGNLAAKANTAPKVIDAPAPVEAFSLGITKNATGMKHRPGDPAGFPTLGLLAAAAAPEAPKKMSFKKPATEKFTVSLAQAMGKAPGGSSSNQWKAGAPVALALSTGGAGKNAWGLDDEDLGLLSTAKVVEKKKTKAPKPSKCANTLDPFNALLSEPPKPKPVAAAATPPGQWGQGGAAVSTPKVDPELAALVKDTGAKPKPVAPPKAPKAKPTLADFKHEKDPELALAKALGIIEDDFAQITLLDKTKQKIKEAPKIKASSKLYTGASLGLPESKSTWGAQGVVQREKKLEAEFLDLVQPGKKGGKKK